VADPGTDAVAVLASGGLDSAILVGQLAREGRDVTPIYVRFGLAWEDVELRYLRKFLVSLGPARTKPLVVLDQPVADIYGEHWSVTGQGVPDRDTPDEAVYLPGRNLLLLAKPSVWCARHGIPAIALGTLAANPFPDADQEFFADFSALVGRALGCGLQVITPFAGRAKREVLDAGREFALHLTFSCMAPRSGRHCGRCNKCAERQVAFSELGIPDTSVYAAS
jgi:7-cyano-7-deazaguanine synthase